MILQRISIFIERPVGLSTISDCRRQVVVALYQVKLVFRIPGVG